jgi:hypothetical protein
MLLECKNCGAPLDVRPSALSARCRYCKATSQTGQLKTVNPETPPGWRAPRVWIPPAHMPAPSVPLEFRQVSPALLAPLLGSLFTLGMLVKVSVSVAQSLGSPPSAPPPAQGRANVWDGRTTFMCSGNEQVTLSNHTVRFTDTPAIVATGNCRLTLEHCNVTGNAPLLTTGNATVRIVGGRLAGLAAGRPAAFASDNSDIVLASGAVLEAPTIAVRTSGNAKVDARGGSVIGTVSESRAGSVSGVAPRTSAAPSARGPRAHTKK